jgi:short-subunit dehydrogenase
VSVLCPPDTDTPQLRQEALTKPPETTAVNGSASLMEPEDVAAALFRGLRRGRFMIVPGRNARLIYGLKRAVPSLVFRVMDRTAEKARAAEMKKNSRSEGR